MYECVNYKYECISELNINKYTHISSQKITRKHIQKCYDFFPLDCNILLADNFPLVFNFLLSNDTFSIGKLSSNPINDSQLLSRF